MDKKCCINNASEILPFVISRLNRDLNETSSKLEVDDANMDDAPDLKKTHVKMKE